MVQLKLKKFITLFLLILGTSNLFSQGLPRIRFTQIQQDTTFGSVLISSPTDSNISYSRNFFITADNILRFYDDTIPLKSYVDSVDATRFDSTQVISLVNDTATNIRNAIPIIISDSLVYYVSDTELNDSLATKLNTSFSNVTGTLPVANGGTGATTLNSGAFLKGNGTSEVSGSSNLTENGDTVIIAKHLLVDTSTLFVDAVNNRVGIGTSTPSAKFNINGDWKGDNYPIEITRTGALRDSARFIIGNATTVNDIFLPVFLGSSNYADFTGKAIGLFFVGMPQQDNSSSDVGIIFDGRLKDESAMTTGSIADFSTANVVRVRFMADGKVGIGTSSPSHPLQMASGAHVTSGGTWTDGSDIKLKENINYYFPYGLNEVMNLKPVVFDYKTGEKNTLGFIAQDVQEYIPEAISTTNDNNGNLTLGLKMVTITATLTKAIQEQQAIINQQQTEIDTLKTSMQSQNEIIQQLISRIEALENN